MGTIYSLCSVHYPNIRYRSDVLNLWNFLKPGFYEGIKLQLLQIAREALANVAKHAAPTRVWIDLEYASGRAFLRIRDDGAGFSSSQPVGHGMGIMRERAGMIEAELAIQSEIGEGTEVSVIYPRGEGPSSTDA